MDLIVEAVGNFLLVQNPGLAVIFSIFGTLTVVASAIDALIPKEKDGDIVQEAFEKPIIRNIVKFLSGFSVLRNKK